jgi:hypothetical protein
MGVIQQDTADQKPAKHKKKINSRPKETDEMQCVCVFVTPGSRAEYRRGVVKYQYEYNGNPACPIELWKSLTSAPMILKAH